MDCNWGKKNADLSSQFNVSGYPTVAFCDPDGKGIGILSSRDPAGVAQQIKAIADKYPARAATTQPSITGMTIEGAISVSRRVAKPVVIFFFDNSPPSFSVAFALQDEILKETMSRFVMAAQEYSRGSDACAKYDVSRVPTILVVDPSLDKHESKPLARISGSRNARELKRDLESILPAVAATPAGASPSPKGAPAPREPEEKLSDDEVERRFIQARVAVAQDMLKRGKKDKAIEVYEDILKSYPKHVDTAAVKKLLEEARK